MKTAIYYFTGTGNSLAAAKKIGASLGDCDLIPIASFRDATGKIVPQADRVGICCPVYFTGLPLMVAEFAGRLDLSRTRYAFGVVTMGAQGGSSTLRQLDGLIRGQRGSGLDAGFAVKMPGNYILMYSAPAGTKQADILASADRQLAEVAPVIARCDHREIPRSILGSLIYAVAYPHFASRAHNEDRKFTVTDACTSCGTCAAVCPAGNIVLSSGRPAWQHRCEVCCACIHLCPAQAIQAGAKTSTRQRYRNPSTSIAELERFGETRP
jgi:Pyruvate/2-oxoacid:ferredoxin oxidoreductase delta subunit